MWLFWLIAAGVFFIGEMITVGFLIFWLGFGSLFAMITSFFTANIVIQTAVFVFSSIILILATKPLINKFTQKDKVVPTNVYSIISKKGIVTEEIDMKKSTGQVKINGEVWSAICDEETIIPVDTEISVLKISGVKVFVEPTKETSNSK